MPSATSEDRLTGRVVELPIRPENGWSDDDLALMGEVFIDAMLTSADVDTIGVSNWWQRATTALETGCAMGDGVRAVASRAAKKLQVETLDLRTTRALEALTERLADPADFARARRLWTRDAVYLVGMVRGHRDEHRTARKAAKTEPVALESLLDPTF